MIKLRILYNNHWKKVNLYWKFPLKSAFFWQKSAFFLMILRFFCFFFLQNWRIRPEISISQKESTSPLPHAQFIWNRLGEERHGPWVVGLRLKYFLVCFSKYNCISKTGESTNGWKHAHSDGPNRPNTRKGTESSNYLKNLNEVALLKLYMYSDN